MNGIAIQKQNSKSAKKACDDIVNVIYFAGRPITCLVATYHNTSLRTSKMENKVQWKTLT